MILGSLRRSFKFYVLNLNSSGSGGLDLLGCLHAVSVAVLLESVHVAKSPHSAGASAVSSLGLGGPVISSLLGVEAATALGVLPLLLMKV